MSEGRSNGDGRGAAGRNDTRTPGGWLELLDELSWGRDTFAVLDGGAAELVEILAGLVEEVISVGNTVSGVESPGLIVDSVKPTRGSVLLTDIEVLFSPEVGVGPAALLRQLSYGRALFVAWPGPLSADRLIYSRPGRADHFDQPARDLIMLKPTRSVFPDEAPYELERFST